MRQTIALHPDIHQTPRQGRCVGGVCASYDFLRINECFRRTTRQAQAESAQTDKRPLTQAAAKTSAIFTISNYCTPCPANQWLTGCLGPLALPLPTAPPYHAVHTLSIDHKRTRDKLSSDIPRTAPLLCSVRSAINRLQHWPIQNNSTTTNWQASCSTCADACLTRIFKILQRQIQCCWTYLSMSNVTTFSFEQQSS